MTAATLRHNGNATATAIDGDGRCNGNAMATTAMERSSDGGGVLTSDGRHLGMLLHYGRASVHLELSSFGYKYSAPPTSHGTASPMPAASRPWTCNDLDRALGHVSKFNSLSYLVRRSLLNPPGGRANDNRRCDCDGDKDDIYGNNGGGGTTTRKAKEEGDEDPQFPGGKQAALKLPFALANTTKSSMRVNLLS